jgi:REP element-mobilizing transposase RayT
MQYRRANVTGGSYFFTVNLADRKSNLLLEYIDDFKDVIRYVKQKHYNPVKHGYVTKPVEWKYSSIHHYIMKGVIARNWGSDDLLDGSKFGERVR